MSIEARIFHVSGTVDGWGINLFDLDCEDKSLSIACRDEESAYDLLATMGNAGNNIVPCFTTDEV